jgi:high-affinity nickel permease
MIMKQDRQYAYGVTLRLFRGSVVAVEKQRRLYYLGVFFALGIQHAVSMRLIVMCGLSRSVQYFPI